MKRSLISLAALAASAHAAVAENIVGASTAWPNTGKKPIEDSKIHIDLDPIALPMLKGNDEQTNELSGFSLPAAKDLNPISIKGNDERFSGIPDGDGVTQWPNLGKSIVYAGQQDRHTPAWMAAVSRRPLNVAARA